MKYRQETVVEKDWGGEFETYDEWARFGPQPPYRSAHLSGCSGSTLYYSARFCLRVGGGGISGEVLLANDRDAMTSLALTNPSLEAARRIKL
jgi:hypothetical protein